MSDPEQTPKPPPVATVSEASATETRPKGPRAGSSAAPRASTASKPAASPRPNPADRPKASKSSAAAKPADKASSGGTRLPGVAGIDRPDTLQRGRRVWPD